MAASNHVWIGTDGVYATAGNWTTDGDAGPPGDTDSAYCRAANQTSITGENQAGQYLALFRTDRGYTGNVGASGTPLIIDAVKVSHYGSGSLYWKSDDNASGDYTDWAVVNSPNMTLAAEFDGEKVDRITCMRGRTVLAATLGTVAVPSVLEVMSDDGSSDGTIVVVYPKSGDTTAVMVTAAFIAGGTLNSTGRIGTVHQSGGIYRQDTEQCDALYLYGGRCEYSSGTTLGTLGAAYVYDGGVLDFTQTPVPKTVTSLYVYKGGVVIRDDDLLTVTSEYLLGGKIISDADPEAEAYRVS